uniref:Transposase n=1 Tax=Streptomyces sp. NBC_00119 TaxID=2975659 RepID=A0AAU1U0N6_9ACTN
MSRKVPLADGETSRTACARALVRAGVDEKTGELLSQSVLAERIGWCADLAAGLVSTLLGAHWNATDVDVLASGEDAGAGSCRRTRGWLCDVSAGPSLRPRA